MTSPTNLNVLRSFLSDCTDHIALHISDFLAAMQTCFNSAELNRSSWTDMVAEAHIRSTQSIHGSQRPGKAPLQSISSEERKRKVLDLIQEALELVQEDSLLDDFVPKPQETGTPQ